MGVFDFLNKKGGAGENPIIPVLPSEIYEAATLELRDIIAPSAVEVQPSVVKIGGKISKTFFVISYPRFLIDGWLSPIINMDKIFDVSIHITPLPSEKNSQTIPEKSCRGTEPDPCPRRKRTRP
ncbi:MAG: hypothetical protein LRY46_03505 [Candidatus Pacebacteria bacterium]|nr:hypothetical protein [Candidatus Paceibacterota bacterium]